MFLTLSFASVTEAVITKMSVNQNGPKDSSEWKFGYFSPADSFPRYRQQTKKELFYFIYLFILFTKEVRVTSHKSELCSHYKT